VSLRTPITLVVLLVVLVSAAYYGWQTVISPATEEKDEPSVTAPTCDDVEEFHKGQLIRAKDIAVNVYNAGIIANLASETLATLSDRGFEPGIADNAPGSVSATNVTIVTDNRKAPQVQLVAGQFRGVIKYAKGNDLDPGIDIVVGDDFQGINPNAERSLRVKRDVTTCASVNTSDTGTASR
jgi:hypothetical protein